MALQLLPAPLAMGKVVLLIKKAFKIICKEQGHAKCEKLLIEEYFRANDDETDRSLGPQAFLWQLERAPN